MQKSVEIHPPKGYEIDKEKSTPEKIYFKESKNNLPMSFVELNHVKGWYFDTDNGEVRKTAGPVPICGDAPTADIWPTKGLAVAAAAMPQLMQLRDEWIEKLQKGWVPDWMDSHQEKYCIIMEYNKTSVFTRFTIHAPISFPKKEHANDFLSAFKELLTEAKPLL